MKKTLFLGLILAASVQMFGASAQDLLKEARNDYYKNLNKKAEPVKVKREKVVLPTWNVSKTPIGSSQRYENIWIRNRSVGVQHLIPICFHFSSACLCEEGV